MSDKGPESSTSRSWTTTQTFLSLLGTSLLVIAALLIGGGAGDSTAAPPPPAEIRTPSDVLATIDGALIGMTSWPRDGDWSVDGIKRRWDEIESAVGRTLDIGHAYHRWNEEDLITWREEWNAEVGRLSLVSWSQTPVGPVIAGEWDDYIAAQADLVARFGAPVLIRWFWEMDGRQRREIAESPERWIEAWRHIVGIFRERGVDNAEFVWCPNAWAFDTGAGSEWYPGDEWVDWLCADGYNWAPGRPDAAWASFGEVFATFHDWARRRDKPVIIAETGAQEREPGEKAAWMRSIPNELRDDLEAVDAIVWFDTPVDHEWWLDTSESSLEAWADVVSDPLFPGISIVD